MMNAHSNAGMPGRFVWHVGQRVSALCHATHNLDALVLGSFTGSFGVLNKNTGRVFWKENNEQNKEQQIVNIQSIEISESNAYLGQTKSGIFIIFEVVNQTSKYTINILANYTTNFATLSPFPFKKVSENKWSIFTTELTDELDLKTISIEYDYSSFKFSSTTSKLIHSNGFLKNPKSVFLFLPGIRTHSDSRSLRRITTIPFDRTSL